MRVTDVEIESYLKEVTEHHKAEYAERYKNLVAPEFEASMGRRYVKIIRWNIGHDHKRYGGSVHCFIDVNNGNIWKAASWSQPQKNAIRGNVFSNVRPMGGYDFYAGNGKFLKDIVV